MAGTFILPPSVDCIKQFYGLFPPETLSDKYFTEHLVSTFYGSLQYAAIWLTKSRPSPRILSLSEIVLDAGILPDEARKVLELDGVPLVTLPDPRIAQSLLQFNPHIETVTPALVRLLISTLSNKLNSSCLTLGEEIFARSKSSARGQSDRSSDLAWVLTEY